jgi:hypothetical protein
MTMSPELIALMTDVEIEHKLDKLVDARARVAYGDVNALAAFDEDIAALKTERTMRARLRRKYEGGEEEAG